MRHWILIPILLAGLGASEDQTSPTTVPAAAPTTAPASLVKTSAPTTAPALLAKSSAAPTTAPTAVRAAATPVAAEPSSRYSRRFSSPRPAIRSLLPVEYAILNERSIFAKGHLSMSSLALTRLNVLPPDSVRPPGPGSPPAPGPYVAPEESLVFDGVTQADSHIVAFVEDRNSTHMNQLKVGDEIARGKVTGLTLDTLDYTAGDRVVHVTIGENLLGVQMAVVPSDTTGATGAAPTSAPSAGSAAPGAPGGAPETMEERLRRRRQQELQGN
jgi:hypothetical protein